MRKSNHRATSGFGTAPVFFTAISTILGAVLFLRFGYAVGTVGFWGAIAIVALGHMITIPTALALSEIATNTRVEGGGEYFIISRSFGLKIGSTIGLALYLSQTISVAFYLIAFAEAFAPLFGWASEALGFALPRQLVSLPTLLAMAYVVVKKGASSGMKMLYAVIAILLFSLLCFFLGNPIEYGSAEVLEGNFVYTHADQFFVLFAICFPAFTGMTAGVGLSGDLRNPARSIPVGTIAGTLVGLVVYVLVVWKLSVSASAADLTGDQLIMSRIALLGAIAIPLGLAASTFSSAVGSLMVAPRTLQALALDHSFPIPALNALLSKGAGATGEPRNASIVSLAIALVFVLMGDVNSVATIISVFFLITYGSLCLISFLNHFGSSPSYRPKFKSRWYFSLAGFVLSVWAMFMISPLYTLISYGVLVLLYVMVERYNKNQKGLVNIFKAALFQLNRRTQVFMQKRSSSFEPDEWRPAAVCVCAKSFEREKALRLMSWISSQHGFGTFFHHLEGSFNRALHEEAKRTQRRLIESVGRHNALYLDTIISPSFASSLSLALQAPSISGMENNMVALEFDKDSGEGLDNVADNFAMVKSGSFDVCILAATKQMVTYQGGIHVWISAAHDKNANLMILLGYIIMANPEWSKSHLKIFSVGASGKSSETRATLEERISAGRLPITLANIEMVMLDVSQTLAEAVSQRSSQAGLAIIGIDNDTLSPAALKQYLTSFSGPPDVLFVSAFREVEIG